MSLRKHGGFLITFVRHGETDLNKNGIVQGQGVDVAINRKGQLQAAALGKHTSNEKYSHVYSSDLLRAKETCSIILSENLDMQSSCIPIKKRFILDRRLRERNYGEVEGRPKQFYEDIMKSGKANPDGAETIREVATRAVSFFNEICDTIYGSKSESTPNILIVSHGRLLATLMAEFSDKFGCTFPSGKLSIVGVNTSRTCINVQFTKNFESSDPQNFKRVKLQCTMLNNSDHLDGTELI